MPAKKDPENEKKVSSAPPVDMGVLRQNKLRPLTSPRALNAMKHAAWGGETAAEDGGKDLPPDMTDNSETDRAVDAVSSKDADKILETEDHAREKAEGAVPRHRIHAFFGAWLGSKRGWKWTLAVLFVLIVVLACLPTSRYWVLNTAGVRVSLSLTAVDGDTQLALPGVRASSGSASTQTDHGGSATLGMLKLGPQTLVLTRPGFAKVTEHVVLGWGSNPLGSIALKDVGQQYSILVHDYVSGNVLSNASVNDSGLQALADKNGKITLTVNNPSEQAVPIAVSAPGYVTKNVTLNGDNSKALDVSLVPSQKEVYVASQAGSYALYSSYVDGSDKQMLLPGTPTETSNIAFAVSPDGSEVALASTRDANYDSSSRLLTALTLVNVADGATLTLDHAEQVQLIGWVGTTVIYEEQTAASPANYAIISYNYATSSRNQLATSSQFTSVSLAAGVVYYSIPASASTIGDGLFSVQPNGSGKQTILSQDIWSMLRTSYTDFGLQSAKGWYDYSIGGSAATTLANPPSNLTSVQYLDSGDGKLSASVTNGQLSIYTVSSGQSRAISTASGAAYPLRWLNSTDLIYRVTTTDGSADYVVNINGSTPKQITSLINTTGVAGS